MIVGVSSRVAAAKARSPEAWCVVLVLMMGMIGFGMVLLEVREVRRGQVMALVGEEGEGAADLLQAPDLLDQH